MPILVEAASGGGDFAGAGGERGAAAPGSQCFELQEDPSFWNDNSVQVIIRIRPLSTSEVSFQGNGRCIKQDSCQSITWTGHPESRFTFDHVADEHISQEKLFMVAGVPMVDNCVAGYNSCMFAYGQTGSGKTHTMLGDIEGGTRRHSVNAGMTPRVFEYLFSRIQKERESRRDEKLQFTCRCSFLEIYNEQILDLLDPCSTNLQIREDARKGVYVENLRELEVSSARDVLQQLVQGASNRKVASTNMNRASSRSHSVFTCIIESKWEFQGVTHHRFARLNLVDLAGSERQKSSGAEGERLKEATNINKSLSTLGLVIMNLVTIASKKASLHVPYRDSKLTFLLQDSLGGNSKTIIIANISPSNCCTLETLSTLKFAQRAKFIRNHAVVNEDASGDVLAMRLQIQQLKKEVLRLQGLANGSVEDHDADNVSASFPGSPMSFKWVQDSFSPLTIDKRLSKGKEYEAALIAVLRREKDKDVALQSLTAGKQAAEQLASQKAEEVKGLKMRLRFREDGIKRLQAVASGKLSAEVHLMQEREQLLKEIEVLLNQVDRNPEVTRFAMENLQLKEELRRLQSLSDEGERDMLNEQITVLQDKLLEALEWKLIHEKDAEMVKDLSTTWDSSINEENEFLRLQTIQSQREVDMLRKNLNACLESKEKLERRVDELVLQEEKMRINRSNEAQALEQNSNLVISSDASSDQIELRTMVEAIAAASQREAEAHELAITLAKENEELQAKLKVLFDDNNKLIELYETAVAEGAHQKPAQVDNMSDMPFGVDNSSLRFSDTVEGSRDIVHLEHLLQEMHEENEKLMSLYEQAMQERVGFKSCENPDVESKHIEQLKQQLQEMHEENEKLMALYEQAMQERDAFKSCENTVEGSKHIVLLKQQLQEMHGEKEKLMALYKQAMQERDESKRMHGDVAHLEQQLQEMHEKNEKLMSAYEQAMQGRDGLKSCENPDEGSKHLVQLKQQLQEMHEETQKLMALYELAMQERDEFKRKLDFSNQEIMKADEEFSSAERLVKVYEGKVVCDRDDEKNLEADADTIEVSEETESLMQAMVQLQQDKIQNEMLTNSCALFGKLARELHQFNDQIKIVDQKIKVKQQEFASVKFSCSELEQRKMVLESKFSVLKSALQTSASNTRLKSCQEQEAQATAKFKACLELVDRKKQEWEKAQSCKSEAEVSLVKARELETQLRENLNSAKLKCQDAENRRKESEKVLFTIENLEKADVPSHRTLHLGKASELLKSEEERKKLASEIKQLRDKLAILQKDIAGFRKTAEECNTMFQTLELELNSNSILLDEAEIELRNITEEKTALLEIRENEKREMEEEFIVDYQELIFLLGIKEAERVLFEDELEQEMEKLEGLMSDQNLIVLKMEDSLREIEFFHAFKSEPPREEEVRL